MMDRVYGLKANKNSKDDISNKIKQLVSAICSKAVKPQMLVDINLYNQGLDLKAFALLSKDKEMSALSIRSINLGQNSIGLDCGCSLLAKPLYKLLKNLDLSSNSIDKKGCSVLAQIDWTCLKIMNLSANNIDSQGLGQLFKSKWIFIVKTLNLNRNFIKSQGMVNFKQHYQQLSKLEQLNLSENQLQAEGICNLSKCQFPSLKKLFISKNQIGDEGCQYLKHIRLPSLQFLHLDNNQIGPNGLLQLKQAQFPNLTLLYLFNNPLRDEGCKYIKQSNWPKLNWLCLSNCGLGDCGLRWLSKSNFPKLQTLRLSNSTKKEELNNIFNKQGCKYFSESHFPILKQLIFSFQISDDQKLKYLLKCDFKEVTNFKIFEAKHNYTMNNEQRDTKAKWIALFTKVFPKAQF